MLCDGFAALTVRPNNGDLNVELQTDKRQELIERGKRLL